MPTVAVNGIHMHYEIQGSGKPVVVINGLGTDISEFEAITRPLAENYKVLAFDNRGSGQSDKPNEPYSIAMMAKDTAELMQAVGFEQANIIGISLGSQIALELTLQHPEVVDKLVLVSAGAKIQRSWLGSLLTSSLLQLLFFTTEHVQPYYAFLRQREAARQYDGSARLSEIQSPTLVMHGLKDKIAPLRLAQEILASIENSRLLGFKGGHIFFLIGRRQQFLQALTSFVN